MRRSSLQILSLFFGVFLFVLGLTIGIVFCVNYSTLSFNLQINNGRFSVFAGELSPAIRYAPPSTSTETTEARGQRVFPPVSMAPRKRQQPKLAFMFLTKGPVVMAPLWEKFFKGHKGFFSIYIHSDPSFNRSETAPESEDSVFFRRRIPSKKVEWGNVNMVEAERRLLANALLDISNQYFILLSESCIPLYNFSTVYSYLINTNQSFVEVYDLPGPVGRGRYRSEMKPTIRISQWRKGSQWFAIGRSFAAEIVSDRVYFPVFKKHCRGSCYADEHYLPTFVTMKFGAWTANRTLTWVDWSRGGRHPALFFRQHVTPEFLERMRTAARCQYNGRETNVCYLFARKFSDHALGRLLRIAPRVMHFNR